MVEGRERRPQAVRRVQGAFGAGKPEIHAILPSLSSCERPSARSDRTVVGAADHDSGSHAVLGQRSQDAIRPGQRHDEPDALPANRVPAEQRPGREPGSTHFDARGPNVPRTLDGPDRGIVPGGGHHEVACIQERGDWRAQDTTWGEGGPGAPRLDGVHGEKRDRRAHGPRLGNAVEHQHVRVARREGDRGGACRCDDDAGPARRESARGDERFVPHLREEVIDADDPGPAGSRAVRVSDERGSRASRRELAHASHGERRLARATEGRSADRDDAHRGRPGEPARERPAQDSREHGCHCSPKPVPWTRAAMLTVDPVRLARRQVEIDRERTAHFPHLLSHKADRMCASPLALLRGSAPLFYELLARHPVLWDGPAGEGWLVGDAHLENFGAYRTGALTLSQTDRTESESVVFDLNDFDDAFVGPWRLDVLRLMTSVVLGGREIGADGRRTLELCDALLDSYVASAFHRRKTPAPPRAITALVDKARARTRKQLLEGRTAIVRGQRRFVRGPRYEALAPKLREKAARAFLKYTKRLPKADRPPAHALDVLDAAFRVAGTGSLGGLRIALLVTGKGGPDGAWIFDMKAEGTPSSACLVRAPRLDPAERVCRANRACLLRPPRMIGATKLRGESMFVRRLAPQEDKLDWTKLGSADLAPLARHLGALLGAAHRRGAERVPRKPWSSKDRARLISRTIALAAAHEAMYLAYCDLVRR
jgi:uncharacterized protein (DUF2252 family)